MTKTVYYWPSYDYNGNRLVVCLWMSICSELLNIMNVKLDILVKWFNWTLAGEVCMSRSQSSQYSRLRNSYRWNGKATTVILASTHVCAHVSIAKNNTCMRQTLPMWRDQSAWTREWRRACRCDSTHHTSHSRDTRCISSAYRSTIQHSTRHNAHYVGYL